MIFTLIICTNCVTIKFLDWGKSPLIWAETKILQGVLPLSWNRNFERGSPTELSLPLGPSKFSGMSNHSVNVFRLRVATRWVGGWLVFLLLSRLWFSKSLERSCQKKLCSQNRGIFHDFNVGLFQINSSQCGTPWSLTGMGLEWCDWN